MSATEPQIEWTPDPLEDMTEVGYVDGKALFRLKRLTEEEWSLLRVDLADTPIVYESRGLAKLSAELRWRNAKSSR